MGKPSKDYAVPLWEKANLTVYEAAAYTISSNEKWSVQIWRIV